MELADLPRVAPAVMEATGKMACRVVSVIPVKPVTVAVAILRATVEAGNAVLSALAVVVVAAAAAEMAMISLHVKTLVVPAAVVVVAGTVDAPALVVPLRVALSLSSSRTPIP